MVCLRKGTSLYKKIIIDNYNFFVHNVGSRSAMGRVRREVVLGNVRTMIGASPTTSALSTMTSAIFFSITNSSNVHTFRAITEPFAKKRKALNQSNASKDINILSKPITNIKIIKFGFKFHAEKVERFLLVSRIKWNRSDKMRFFNLLKVIVTINLFLPCN